jgi:hypothetical protein
MKGHNRTADIDVETMDEAVIIQALEQACQGLELTFQVIYQQETLYVCFDRQAERVLDYDALTVTVRDAIAALNLPNAQAIMLLGRVLGETAPDWQTTIEQTTIEPIQPAIATEASFPSSQPDDIEGEELLSQANAATHDLSQYCFIRNKALVTTEVLPPDMGVAELVQAFHNLSDADKQILLPRLEQIFKSHNLGDTSQDSEAIAHFCAQLTALSSGEIRKAAIWLSRYCHNPEGALGQVKSVLDPVSYPSPSVETEAPKPSVNDGLRYQSGVSQPSNSAYEADNADRKNHRSMPKATWQLILIPVLWTFLTLGIVWYNVQANNGPGAIAQLCKNAKDYPQYCKLAVQIVGTQQFETYSKQTQPSTENVAGMAAEDCTLQSVFNAGGTMLELAKEANKEKAKPSSISTQEILTGLFLVDVTHTSFKDGVSAVRTACVYGTVQSRVTQAQRAASLGNHLIPNQWPQEPLKTKPYNVKLADSQSIYGILSLLGTNTLFTAIGLFLVVCFGLGIRLESLNALYTAAFIFGMVDAMMSLIPMIGFFGIIRFTAVPVVGLMITSFFVKGMELDFTGGYKLIALGGGLLVGVRFLLSWLLLITIMSMM